MKYQKGKLSVDQTQCCGKPAYVFDCKLPINRQIGRKYGQVVKTCGFPFKTIIDMSPGKNKGPQIVPAKLVRVDDNDFMLSVVCHCIF